MAITNEQLLETVSCVGAALEKGEAAFKERRESMEKAAAELPATSAAILRSGLVEEHEAEDLKRVLGDHHQTLKFLQKVAQHYASALSEAQPAPKSDMGKPYAENGKSASHAPQFQNYPGQKTVRLRESDRLWYQMMTGRQPEE